MHLIIKIFCFSLLFSLGNSEFIFKCTGMISKDTAVINENDQLVCTCTDTENYHGHNEIKLPINSSYDDNTLELKYTFFKKSSDNKTVTLIKNDVPFWDAGYYGCYSADRFYMERIYVWVRTKKQYFTPHTLKWASHVHYSHNWLEIFCVPTSPCYDVKLFGDSQEVIMDETNGFKFDARKGFLITNSNYLSNIPKSFTCSITFDGRTEKVFYKVQNIPKANLFIN